jgi:hypothetical protein
MKKRFRWTWKGMILMKKGIQYQRNNGVILTSASIVQPMDNEMNGIQGE